VDTADAFALHMKRRRAEAFGVDQALATVTKQPHRQQPDLPMTQTEHVIAHLAHSRTVINAHLGCAGHVFGLINHHQRQPPVCNTTCK